MKPRDAFGLAVRIAGLVSLLYVLAGTVLLIGFGMPWQVLAKTIVWLLASAWLLRGAPQLVRFAYPEEE